VEQCGRGDGRCQIEKDVVRGEVVAVVDAANVMEVRVDEEGGTIDIVHEDVESHEC